MYVLKYGAELASLVLQTRPGRKQYFMKTELLMLAARLIFVFVIS